MVRLFRRRRSVCASRARAPAPRARHRARAVAPRLGRGGPRDLAALRDGADRGGSAAATARVAAEAVAPPPAPLAEIVAQSRPSGRLVDRCAARWPTSRRCSPGTAASSRRLSPELDELRTLRDDSRRLIVDAGGALSRRDRHRGAEDPAQQHARLLHRGHRRPMPTSCLKDAARFIHRQTMANAMRFTTAELADLEHRIATPPTRRWRWSWRCSTISSAR